jgi:cysteine synthase
MKPAQGLLGAIGNTPLVELARLRPANGARILAKLEGSNPGDQSLPVGLRGVSAIERHP